MLAGDVWVTYTDGELVVKGDQLDNAIEIIRLENGDAKVLGALDSDGIGTRINGGNSITIKRPNRINTLRIGFNDGDDSLALRNLPIETLSVNLGSGDDTLSTLGVRATGQVFVATGAGADQVSLAGLVADDGLRIVDDLAGSGDGDHIEINHTTVVGSTLIDVGGGSNLVRIGSSTLHGTTTIRTSGGDDVVNLDHSGMYGSISIDTGDGDDVARVTRITTSSSAAIELGDGNDFLLLSRMSDVGALSVNAGSGIDRLHFSDIISSNFMVNTGDSNDNDVVFLDTVSAFGSLVVKTGDGNDRVEAILIGIEDTESVLIDGGEGFDVLVYGYVRAYYGVDFENFEKRTYIG